MKNQLLFLLIVILLFVGVYFYYENIVIAQPVEKESLEKQIDEKNKQLLAAQILSEKREGINQLIQQNLINVPGDSLTEKASISFLRYLTSILDRLKIRLVALTPLDVIGKGDVPAYNQKEYIEVPYELKIIASYKEFGKLLDILEKSPHLIEITSFTVANDIERTSYVNEISGKPDQHSISLQISTLAILKASYRSESREFN
jgi:hypothetical protein